MTLPMLKEAGVKVVMKGTREGPGCAPPGGRPSPSRFWTSVLMERKKVLLYPLVLRTLKRILVAVCTSSILVQILLNLNSWDFTSPLYVCLG